MDDSLPKSPSPDALAARSAAALRELHSRSESVTTTRRERMSRLEDELARRLDTIAGAISEHQSAEAKLAEDLARSQSEIAELQTQCEAREQKLDERGREVAEIDGRQQQRERELDERRDELDRRLAELTRREHELEARQTDIEAAAANSVATGDAQGQQETEWQARLDEAERSRAEAAARLADLEAREADWNSARTTLEHERDNLKSELAAAQQANSSDTDHSAMSAELGELKQKFSLALDDVQRFRARAAELEQELAERPAQGSADSAELIALRAERDALVEKVEELESRAPAASDAVDSQELADLQRRFEMAVEDVRELKTKNARLESQLTADRQHAPSPSDAGGMDWESQKRRLLASLEGDAGETINERERTTIESTIQITDAVVAEKDELIQELKTQLAAKADVPAATDAPHAQAVKELVDADQIIAEHRRKAAEFEQELEGKLRTFELEMSVDRARIARQKVELDQLRQDLETEKNTLNPGAAHGGGPKRRWLSKLGLGGEESE